MSSIGGMSERRLFALANPAALIAPDNKVTRIGKVVILISQLQAEIPSTLKNLVAVLSIPGGDIEGVVYLVFRPDLSNPIVVDVRPHQYTALVILAFAILDYSARLAIRQP